MEYGQRTLEGDIIELVARGADALPLEAEIYADDWDGEKILTDVLTITEVCKLWGVTKKTVRMRCFKGHFEYRVTERVYLIARRSVVKVWGIPTNAKVSG